MRFSQLWPFYLTGLIPFIIILYLLKQKTEDYRVSSLFLWKESLKNITAASPFQKFRNNLLMYLQILTTLVLILTLASPYLLKSGNDIKRLILVIDNSGSMNRMYDEKRSRLEAGIEMADHYIEDMAAGGKVTVISYADTAEIEISDTDDEDAVRKDIESIKPTDLEGNMTSAQTLLHALKEQQPDAEIVIFTDTYSDLGDLDAKIIDLSSEYSNLYINYVNHTEKDRVLSALVHLSNDGEETVTTDINLYGDNELLAVSNVTVKGGSSADVLFDNLAFAGNILKAEIQEKDSLPDDNISYDVMDSNQEINALLVTDQNVFLEKALEVGGDFTLYKTNDVSNIKADSDYDLYIFDGMLPTVLPESGSLFFVNTPSNQFYSVEEKDESGIVQMVDSNVTQYMDDYNFGVNSYQKITKPDWGATYLTLGDSCLGFYGNSEGRNIAVIGFDMHESELPLEAEFPMLIRQIISQLTTSDFLDQNKTDAGGVIEFRGKPEGGDIKVYKGTEKDPFVTYDTDTVYFADTDSTGVYRVSQEIKEETNTEYFAVNFPSKESVDQPVTEQEAAKMVDAGTLEGSFSLTPYIIIFCLILLLVEWILYLRRI